MPVKGTAYITLTPNYWYTYGGQKRPEIKKEKSV